MLSKILNISWIFHIPKPWIANFHIIRDLKVAIIVLKAEKRLFIPINPNKLSYSQALDIK